MMRSADETTLLIDDITCDELENNNDDDDDDDDVDKNIKFLRESLADIEDEEYLSTWTIICILSSSFAYGCIMTTLFLITLPIECDRIEKNTGTPKSIALGCFVAISGVTQLISPLVGMLSDTYRPPSQFQLGQRVPYMCFGAILSVLGLLGEYINSYHKLWIPYAFFFSFHMIGLNISYAMMIAMIPDQVPDVQTGKANGILAFLLVTGSLFGFGLFRFEFNGQIQDMYGVYICIVIVTTIVTSLYAHDRDVRLFIKRLELSAQSQSIARERHLDTAITKSQRRRRRRRILLSPLSLLKTMFYDPIILMDRNSLIATYSIDTQEHHDFFIVTISRLFYYCGSSVQTFFLYFLHDIIHVKDDPEAAVSALAVVSQISGALICYPVGQLSDQYFGGRRSIFVYISCLGLASITFSMIWAKTMNHMMILCFLLGAANGSYLTMETSLAIDTLPKKMNDGPSGGNAQLLGIWGIASFLGSALGPMIGGPLLYLFGNSEIDSEQDYSIEGYALILSLSALYFLLSAVALQWVRVAS